MMIFKEFEEKWKSIMPSDNGFLRLAVEHPLNLHIGYKGNKYRSLIVMDTGIVNDIPSSKAVHASNVQLANGTWILQFELVYDAFEEVFLRLCWDMIESTSQSKDCVNDLIARYRTWQKLLQYEHPNVLSFTSQKGLIGELLFLKNCIETLGAAVSVNAWIGPDGGDQDFVFENTWAEIKSVALASQTINITSLQQLEQEMPGTIEIFILEKAPHGTKWITLSQIIDEVRELLLNTPQILDKLDMKLFKCGFREKDKDEYTKFCFRLVEQLSYLVDASFPKLTRKNVPPAIVECGYSISLASIEAFRR